MRGGLARQVVKEIKIEDAEALIESTREAREAFNKAYKAAPSLAPDAETAVVHTEPDD